jgi:predicted transcriptional regulator
MAAVKITAEVDEALWNDLSALARTTRRGLPVLLTEAIHDYLRRHQAAPEVLAHLEDSMDNNATLGDLLAR